MRCPSCGRRFSVRVDKKVLVDREEGTEKVVHNIVVLKPRDGVIPAGAVTEDVPIERDTFLVTYECRHCHHRWSENLSVVKRDSGSGQAGHSPR